MIYEHIEVLNKLLHEYAVGTEQGHGSFERQAVGFTEADDYATFIKELERFTEQSLIQINETIQLLMMIRSSSDSVRNFYKVRFGHKELPDTIPADQLGGKINA